MPVDYTTAVLRRVCVDYNTVNGGNKHTTPFSGSSTRHFVPTTKLKGYTPMLTAPTGQPRPKTAPPVRLSTFTIPAESEFSFPESDLAYIPTPNGILITHNHLLVAWIFKGHAGSRNNIRPCQFYDVAFPALTTDPQNRITGVMLDSTCFDSLESAVQFVESSFASSEVSA